MSLDIWQDFSSDIFGYAFSAYDAIEPWFWPFVFVGIIGYLYAGMQSVTVAVVGILITFGIFATTTSVFEEVPAISQFFYIIAILGITLLMVGLVLKRGR